MSNFHGARLMIDTFLQAVACGFYVIPMRTLVQEETPLDVRARVISASNMMDALFMLISALIAAGLLSLGLQIEELYLLVSVLTFIVGIGLFFEKSLQAN